MRPSGSIPGGGIRVAPIQKTRTRRLDIQLDKLGGVTGSSPEPPISASLDPRARNQVRAFRFVALE